MINLVCLCLVLIGAGACKKNFAAGYDGSDVLGIDTNSMRPISEVTNTPTAGEQAEKLGYAPKGGTETGLRLEGGDTGVKEGMRICISSSYGKDKENAVVCGVAKRCDSFEGFYAEINWEPGELCMRTDCLSKTNAGLVAPGTEPVTAKACDTSKGRPTLFSLTEYAKYVNRFALSAGTKTALADTDQSLYYGDKFYAKTSASRGSADVNLGGEKLYNGDIMLVEYASTGVGLNGPAADSVARVGYTQQGLPMFYEFVEGGSVVTETQSKRSSLERTSANAPSATDLGIVTTRRGNTFQLSDENNQKLYGPSGTAKLYVESK